VIISIPPDAFEEHGAIRDLHSIKAFLCTDRSLDAATILQFYSNRWCIETFFEQMKRNLGFDKYQIRSVNGIERLWHLMSLCHLICSIGLKTPMPFGDGLRYIRQNIHHELVDRIYQCAQINMPLRDLYALSA
jgi:hypothetical protein